MKTKLFRIKRNQRWSMSDHMFSSLLLTSVTIELSQVGAGFIDGLVISRCLGPEAMAAEGIVHPIYSMLGVIRSPHPRRQTGCFPETASFSARSVS